MPVRRPEVAVESKAELRGRLRCVRDGLSRAERASCAAKIGDHLLADAVRHHEAHAVYSTELLTSDDPLDLLAAESKKFDLLIVGTTKVGFFKKAVVGSFAANVVEKAKCSVAAVRVISPVIRTLKRVT